MFKRRLLIPMALALACAAPQGNAASTGLGGTSTGFICDINTRTCKCDGIWEGADCQAMKKNCRYDDWEQCLGDSWCKCTMKSGVPAPTLNLKLQGKTGSAISQ
jgi:hypothetical protein